MVIVAVAHIFYQRRIGGEQVLGGRMKENGGEPRLYWWLIAAWLLVGCGGGTPALESTGHLYLATEWDPIVDEEPPPPGDVRHLKNCAEYPFEPPLRGPWETIDHQDLADGAEPRHRAADWIVALGDSVTVEATMAYNRGPLFEEWVRLFVGDCQGWKQVATRRTDGEGEVAFRLPERPQPGAYGLVFQASGDATAVGSQLWVVPPKTELVVFEIQGGTFDEDGQEVPGAAELARWHAQQGALVAYIARVDDESPPGQANQWREKLRGAEFPVGPVVELDVNGAQRAHNPTDLGAPDGWGEANGDVNGGAPIERRIDLFYAAQETSATALVDQRMRPEKVIHFEQGCRQFAQEADQTDSNGWECVLSVRQNSSQ